ncbi:MAG: 50S ribosomal protein L23 [Elusimicrobia bacterium]|nr:50S ribosomal protein L23 [Elusimicrobiota bacterium]
MNPYQIIKKTVVTEKSTLLKNREKKYTFLVDKRATKNQISSAFKEIFGVDVDRITTMVMPGKLRRMGRYSGYRPDVKKAIIKLKEGQEIKTIEETS